MCCLQAAPKRAPAAKKATSAQPKASDPPAASPPIEIADEAETQSYGSLAERLGAMNVAKAGATAKAKPASKDVAAHGSQESYGSLAERLGDMKVAKAGAAAKAKPAKKAAAIESCEDEEFMTTKPAPKPRAGRAAVKKAAIVESSDEEDDIIEVESSDGDGEPEVISPHPTKAKGGRKAQTKDQKPKKAPGPASIAPEAPPKRKPAAARKPKPAAASPAPPTPQATRTTSFELESPSPALAHQGKASYHSPDHFALHRVCRALT